MDVDERMSVIVGQPGPGSSGGLPDPPQGRARTLHRDLAREIANPLGAYLQARRGLVTPEKVGLRVTGVRRVPGLRREEVAMLAGISADYYLRLERGKVRTPSQAVLAALARALQLDADHIAHLRSLASEPVSVPASAAQDEVPNTVLQLIETLDQPAFIEDSSFTVQAANLAARDLNPRLVPGRNQIIDLFLDEDEQALHPDWEGVAACLTASLRHSMGARADDDLFRHVIDRLAGSSSRFRQIWARHDVRAQRGAAVRISHPKLGERVFNREQLRLSGTDRVKLVIYYPEGRVAIRSQDD